MAVSACDGCGLELPVREGPTHAYFGASAACWALFGEVLAREFGDPDYFRLHQLTVRPEHPRDAAQPARSRAGGGRLDRARARGSRRVVTLTGAGERQLERAAQAQRDAEDELFAGLTDTERAQLRGLLLVLGRRLTPEQNTACTSADTAEPT